MIIGIDLGTTNSLAAVLINGKVELIPNRLGEFLTPSVVSIDENGNTYIGKTAVERKAVYPNQTADVFKRSMGTKRQYQLGKGAFTAMQLSSLVLKSLKEDVESYLKEEVEEAVISVPAYFSDQQRRATKEAGELAGFKVDRIVSEPTCAAIAFGLKERKPHTKFLVFDLGGGTFDVSILEMHRNIMEVRAVAGDNYLGGEDFTDILIQMFYKKKKIDVDNLSEKTMSHVRQQAEICKLLLSDSSKAVMTCRIDDQVVSLEVSASEYEDNCQLLLNQIRKPVEKSLRDAGIHLSDIDEVVLVGGATRLPMVRRFVGRMMGKLPNVSLDPDKVVVIGAAMQAAMKERNESLKEMILTDVCPYTLGAETTRILQNGLRESGHYLPIIERNSVIPVSVTERAYTIDDDQKHVCVAVYQGESRLTRNNLYLGELEVPVPQNRAGEEAVDITYTYDVNSVLSVEVTVVSTGFKKQMYLKNEMTDMSEDELDNRFAELKVLTMHPREEEENKLLLMRAERLYEESRGDIRQRVEYELHRFESVLNKRDTLKIEKAYGELKSYLDSIEEDRWEDD